LTQNLKKRAEKILEFCNEKEWNFPD